jgi:mRNA (guanine-N7-)-methyltransferase
VLLVFDAIAVNGQNVGTDNSLIRRLLHSENWLLSADGPNVSEILLPFHIRTKAMRSVLEIQGMLTFIDMNTNDRCWHYRDERANDGRYHHSDGLVFTPATEIYHDSLALKWKPAEMISVDFAVLLNDMKEALSEVKRGLFDFKFPGSCSHGNALITLASIGIIDETDAFVIAPVMPILDERKKHMIVECTFDKTRGFWRPFRLRTDKVVPNSVSTAWATLEVASASMTINELVENTTSVGPQKVFSADYEGQKVLSAQARKVLGEASPYIILTKVGAGGANDIASHYDSIQRDRNEKCEGGKDGRMDMLRKVNNWAKAGMFMLISSVSNSRDVMTVDQTTTALSYLESHGRTLIFGASESLLKYNPQKSPLELHSPSQVDRKQKKPFPYKERRVKALDICCGRGGDINKLSREFMLDLYVGIDLSLQELKEAEGRAAKLFKQRKNPKKFMFIHGDAAAEETMHVLDVLAGRRDEPPEGIKVKTIQDCQFDLAFCQFALHYFCDDSERLRNILRIVSQSLKLGSRFSASFPNPYHVDLRLKKAEHSETDPSSLCTIRKVSAEQPSFENFNKFGIEYIFSLGDAVQNCREFIVPLPLVIEMAREEGLALVKLLPMQDFILSMLRYPETDQLRTPMSVLSKSGGAPDRSLSDEEWRAIGVYCIAAWEKMA